MYLLIYILRINVLKYIRGIYLPNIHKLCTRKCLPVLLFVLCHRINTSSIRFFFFYFFALFSHSNNKKKCRTMVKRNKHFILIAYNKHCNNNNNHQNVIYMYMLQIGIYKSRYINGCYSRNYILFFQFINLCSHLMLKKKVKNNQFV